jgi:uncharacterized OsmC-like protein
MKVTTIRVHYTIKLPKGKTPDAERALEHHEKRCPAATSVRDCIGISWTADFVEEE